MHINIYILHTYTIYHALLVLCFSSIKMLLYIYIYICVCMCMCICICTYIYFFYLSLSFRAAHLCLLPPYTFCTHTAHTQPALQTHTHTFVVKTLVNSVAEQGLILSDHSGDQISNCRYFISVINPAHTRTHKMRLLKLGSREENS